MHSEAKQSKMSEFGTEKGLLQGTKQGEQAAHAQKTQTPQWFWGKSFFVCFDFFDVDHF